MNEKTIQSYDVIPENLLYDSFKQRSKENIVSISPDNIETDEEKNKKDDSSKNTEKKNEKEKKPEKKPEKKEEKKFNNEKKIKKTAKSVKTLKNENEEENLDEKKRMEKKTYTKVIKIITKKPLFVKLESSNDSNKISNIPNIEEKFDNNINFEQTLTNPRANSYRKRQYFEPPKEKFYQIANPDFYYSTYNYQTPINKRQIKRNSDDQVIMNSRNSPTSSKKNYNLNKFYKKLFNTPLAKINETNLIGSREKLIGISLGNGINCLIEIDSKIFAIGNSIGDIILFNNDDYQLIQKITEHKDMINSLYLLHDKAILSASKDKTMKKIKLTNNYKNYIVEFVFSDFKNNVTKAIQLNNKKIISNDFGVKISVWSNNKNLKYENEKNICMNQKILDIIEISSSEFATISENEINFWDSNYIKLNHNIKNINSDNIPNSICKIKDDVLVIPYKNQIQLIDLNNYEIVNNVVLSSGNICSVLKLKNNSVLFGEEIKEDDFWEFNMQQYVIEGDELNFVSLRKEKYHKKNENGINQVKVMIELSNGAIVQGINKIYNGKENGVVYLYY